MKSTSIILAAALAVTYVSAMPGPSPGVVLHYCHDIGQPCLKLRDATDLAAAALNQISKRDVATPAVAAAEVALRDAIHIANDYNLVSDEEFEKRTAAYASLHYCHDIGEPCLKTKRDTPVKRDGQTFVCSEEGDVCTQVISAASSIDEAYNTPEKRDPWWLHYCHDIGQPCLKAKRALDFLKETSDAAVALLSEN